MSHTRVDHQIISNLIKKGSSVLDLGCGRGDLLKLLSDEKDVSGMGVEKDFEMINECLLKGLSVIQANVDHDLKDYQDKSFDYVVLSLTLQALKKPEKVLQEMLRIGKKAIVSFPNFGNIWIRLDLMFRGTMPKSRFIPYEWFNTPNIHFCSIKDFKKLCKFEKFRIDKKIYMKKRNKKILSCFPNLFASTAIFVLEN